MLTRRVNFYISALVITVFGSLATLFIVHTSLTADSIYDEVYFAPANY